MFLNISCNASKSDSEKPEGETTDEGSWGVITFSTASSTLISLGPISISPL